MNNNLLIRLAHRAVAATRWRWMRGMSTVSGWVVVSVDEDLVTLDRPGYTRRIHTADRVSEGEIPDLTDPATIGCLFALMNDAQGHGDWKPNVGAMVCALERPWGKP